ncbi:unnamed protein product [Rotaria magnacalcarata]|uniref:Uncharacterized protein n=2 Tax=Rotaria magnacalcarata TaxID=392030 RepID=A0A814W0T8_9BILA|nr:unnamed protein product [Rotaria magnacalcarata]CAF1291394.1 unnamed protein product [Rotaria magnacalcarata]CAF5169594.1 unnamed protein product [Rotaria magnacalcarata]
MTQNKVQYYILSFTTTGTCRSYDELKQWRLDDDCYEKLYPAIANNILLEGLTQFVENETDYPEKPGIANSTIYKKGNGRKIDSSRNYKLVREADDIDVCHLYVEITKGRNLGHFKMLTHSVECEYLLTVALENMRDSGSVTTAKDLKDAADKENLFIARERCEFINRCVLANIAITTATTTILYDVTKLGNDSNQKPKRQQQQQQTTTTRTKKPVVSTSKCFTKSSDSEEDNDKSAPKLKTQNIQLTPKLYRLRSRTAGAANKKLTNNSHTCSASSSSSEKRQKKRRNR